LQAFLNQFENAKSAIREAGANVADQAVGAAQELSTRAFKLALDISLKAPVIVVPENSKSTNVIVIDLGQLVVTNKFQKLTDQAKSSDGQYAVLDDMTVDLTHLNISRYFVCHAWACCLVLYSLMYSLVFSLEVVGPVHRVYLFCIHN